MKSYNLRKLDWTVIPALAILVAIIVVIVRLFQTFADLSSKTP